MEKILIVDDDDSVRKLLKDILATQGYDCTTAADAAEAHEFLASTEYQLVVTDLNMPGESGLDFIPYALSEYPDLAAIVVTGIEDLGVAQSALELGVFDYVSKPIERSRVITSVTNALHRRELKIENRIHRTELETLVEKRTRELKQAISSLETAQETLRESEYKFKNITQSAHDGIIMMDDDGKVSYWNKAAEKIFGYLSQEALGRDLHELIAAPPSVEAFRGGLDGFRRTGQGHIIGKTIEVKAMRKDGTEFPAELSLSTLKLSDRWNALGIVRDITERKALESQLMHAQKLESIGQLAAGIAHEINTPTQFVGDNTRFLRDAFADIDRLLDRFQTYVSAVKTGHETDELLGDIETAADEVDLPYLREEIPLAINQALEGVERVAKIVRAMKEFSHPGAEGKTPIDLNHAIESTITVARNEWKYVAEMETEFDPALPAVPCLPGDFNQVILNMIVNAAHAIGETVGNGSNGKGAIRVNTHRNGDFAEIRISDTGTGIPENIRNRIFDPFFTTKAVGKGTGQGLAIAYSVIVDKHGGHLDVESEVGKGTCFSIRLPLNGS